MGSRRNEIDDDEIQLLLSLHVSRGLVSTMI